MSYNDEFQKKTYGRIWVQEADQVEKVNALIKEIDAFEWDYLPDDFIAVYDGDLEDVIWGHKFELDIAKLTQECLFRGIWIACVTGRCS